MNPDAVKQTLDAIMKAQASPMADPRFALIKGLNKADTFVQSGTATSGLTYYDLEIGAKFLYPVLTPLRNEIPRVSGKGGIQANWRAVTQINTTGVRPGVSGGNRGAVIAVATKDYTAAYRGLGLEDNVDFEAQYAGMGFDDIRGIATKTLLESLMLGEESTILGGNSSFALNGGAATTTPSVVDVATGGTLLPNTAYLVQCAALTFDGYQWGSVSVLGCPGQITRTNADGSSDTFGGGVAKVSAAGTATTANDGNSTHSLTVSLAAAIPGAVAYAWYLGVGAGNERINQITTSPTATLTDASNGTYQLASALGAADNSTNTLVFDGLIYQALASGSGSYVSNVAGTLTGDSSGGVNQIETALKSMWDNYRLGPDTMWVNSQQARDISTKILANGSSGAQRFVFQTEQDMLRGGTMVRTYLNRYSMAGGSLIDIKIHPNMPAGMILMTSKKLPYPLSNVGNVMQVRTRQDYYQIEWPLRSRKYEYGVYCDEVLQHYFPPSMALLYNITAG
jgi:hypothetical protein